MPLITPAEAKAFIPGIKGTGQDLALAALIEAADQALAAYCRYPAPSEGGQRTLCSEDYVLYMDGPGGQELHLPVAPVTTLTSIYDDPDRAYGATTLVDSGDYTLYAEEGLVTLDYDAVHGSWSKGRRALKVTVTSGYTSANVPDFVRQACGMLVAEWYRKGIPEIGAAQGDARPVADQKAAQPLPPTVKSLISPLRRLHQMAA